MRGPSRAKRANGGVRGPLGPRIWKKSGLHLPPKRASARCESPRHDPWRVPARRRRHRGERGAPDGAAHGGKHGGSADPGGVAFSFLRGEPRAAVRPHEGVRDAAQRAGGDRGALRARGREGGDPGGAGGRARGPWPERAHRRARGRPEPGREREARGGGRLPRGRLVSLRLPRRQYADLYGPTVGDRVRLADTDLLIEIERDFTAYGDEVKFGGGKVIRDGMGQSAR